MRRRPTLLTLLAVAGALVWTGFVARPHVLGRSSPIDRFEEVCLDLRYLLSPVRVAPSDVVIVAIDDETVRAAGAFPLPRAVLASLIEAIARQKPRAIALDLLFLDNGPPEADLLLAEALRSAPTVIAAAGLFRDDAGRDRRAIEGALAAIPVSSRILWPIDALSAASEVGLVNLSTGFAGTPRHAPLLFGDQGSVSPSFVLLAAALGTGQSLKFVDGRVTLGARSVALDLGQHLVLRYYGARGAIPSVGAAALDAGGAAALEGRVVLVGATAVGSGDTFPTPYSTIVPGVEILATAIDNLLAGDALVRTQTTRWLDTAAAVLLSLAAIGLIAMRRSLVGLGLVLGLAGAWALATLVAFNAGYWLSTTLPIAAMAPVAVLYGSVRLVQERRMTTRLADVERGLRPFQPRALSDLLGKDPQFLAEPQVQDAAVLFVDLAGYTSLSEGSDSVWMRDLLKSFHSIIDQVVDAHGGFVATFMGDGAMILFGFPDPRGDDAAQALAALGELQSRLEPWGSVEATGLPQPLQARVTAHYGPVVISRLGGETHQQITATGDTVNVASRLHDVAKTLTIAAVVTENIVQAAGGEASGRFPERMKADIRGRQDPVWVRFARS